MAASRSISSMVVGATSGAAALVDRVDQIGFGDQHLGVQQTHAVRQHVAALVVVEHAGDRAAFDRGQHHQHRVG